MKIALIGGHLTPALAFIEYVQAEQPATELAFIGRLFARKQSKQPAHEKEEVEKRGVPFFPFDSGKLGVNPALLILEFITLLISVPKAALLLWNIKPTVVLSFGGYLAVPIAVASWLLRIPLITHEQTHGLGSANRIIGLFAKKIALSHQESKRLTARNKTVVTGNPIRRTLMMEQPPMPTWVGVQPKKPLLYITGGSQGSEIINSTISQMLPELSKNWFVIHQCGTASATRNYLRELTAAATKLHPKMRPRYIVREWISETELAWIYQHATASISRAGANTIDELVWFGIPSILIPLPFSHQHEQRVNANAVAGVGGAIVIEQKDLHPKSVLNALATIHANAPKMRASLLEARTKQRVCEQLFTLLQDVQA